MDKPQPMKRNLRPAQQEKVFTLLVPVVRATPLILPFGRWEIMAGIGFRPSRPVLFCIVALLIIVIPSLSLHWAWKTASADRLDAASLGGEDLEIGLNLVASRGCASTTTTTSTQIVRGPTQTVTRTVRLPATNSASAARTKRIKDVFGFPVLVESDAPLPDETVQAHPAGDSDPTYHVYRKDGLLETNANGPHPIFELMDKAEAKWKAKNEKASTTLKGACEEYERRYGRKPPKGFETWWIFVRSNNVPLPDEYDQIDRDLGMFWGIDPRVLQKSQSEWGKRQDSFTMGKDNDDDAVALLTYAFHDESRKKDFTFGVPLIQDVLEEVAEYMPKFRAVFSPHDGPNLLKDYELVDAARKAAKEGRYIDHNNPPKRKWTGWISACPPGSPVWTNRIDYTKQFPPLPKLSQMKYNTSYASSYSGSLPPKTFIHDHTLAMDPCLHPSHLMLHGQFLGSNGPAPESKLVPLFSYSPSMLHQDITVALTHGWQEDILPASDNPEFHDKTDSRLQWRGSSTGMQHDSRSQWWLSQRPRLVDWANLKSQRQPWVVDSIMRSPLNATWKVGDPGVLEKKAKAGWAPAMADVTYSGVPIGCTPEMCRGQLANEYEFRVVQNVATQGTYKYIIDVDGNGWSTRYKRLLTSNSLIFKSTIYREWFADRIEPWLHYVPIQVDYSDLLDALYFFRGDPSGHGGHPELARKIAENGREWSLTHWRKVDLTAYMFRLLLEYSRIMSVERENGGLDYIYDASDEYEEVLKEVGRESGEGKPSFGELARRRRGVRRGAR